MELQVAENRAQQQQSTLTEQYQKLKLDYDILSQQHQEQCQNRLAQMSMDYDTQKQQINALRNQIQELQTHLGWKDATVLLTPSLSENNDDNHHHQLPSPVSASTSLPTQTTDNNDHSALEQSNIQTKYTDVQLQSKAIQQQLLSSNDVLAQQHKKELEFLHNQYQQAVDIKDQELEAYSYRVTGLIVNRQKDLESCRVKADDRIHALEHQIEGYQEIIRSDNEEITALRSQLDVLEQQMNQGG
ncbi:uncharacterized protein BX664DRAFT_344469 [Halteromyces radiatus]|uniref:uncharacterized protein n=1 Tax=Halteromyces radiatus TaxID=101107 RepID=UPI00221F84D2|nr:uncharacterized protein BX664DRAFT_344469 [Halteromyces radiatus]KAI8076365.1 hypothetical protein BX664DRAFT_344469 [Halteromyces radiatus]